MLRGWTATATHLGTPRTLSPVCDTFDFSDVADDGRPTFTRNLTTKLTLEGEDYDWLRTIYEGADACAEISLVLTYGTFSWSGTIPIQKVEWQRKHKLCSFTPGFSSVYEPIDSNLEDTVNIFTLGGGVTASVLFGTIETDNSGFQTRPGLFYPFDETDASAPPAGDGWELVSLVLSEPTSGDTVEVVEYAREVVVNIGTPPGQGWIDQGGNLWARSPSLSEPITTDDGLGTFTYDRTIVGETDTYDNGILFRNVVNSMFTTLGFTVNSRFLFLGDTTANAQHDATVYQYAEDYLWDLLIFQKSDIKRPDAGTNATAGEISYGNILDILRNALNLQYEEESTGVIRIEHYSYFTAGTGLDLSVVPFSIMLAGQETESGEEVNIPQFETFSWAEETDANFDGVPIIYPAACSQKGEEENLSVPLLNNNVIALTQDSNDSYTDAGFTFVSTVQYNGLYRINSATVPTTGEDVLNAPMGWPMLHAALFLHGRKYIQGRMNNNSVTFESAQDALQYVISVTGLSPENFAAFDPVDTITTPLGVRNVNSSNYSSAKGTLTLTLGY